ncbi:hypothetical protein Vretimale_19312, partial [Volvox reticuliferus]
YGRPGGASGWRSDRPGDSSRAEKLEGWYVDSDASHHITYDARDLTDVRKLDERDWFDIIGVGGEIVRPIAVGTLQVAPSFCWDMRVTVGNVYVAPSSCVKVLSVAAFSEKGVTVRFDKYVVNICRRGRVVLTGHRAGNLYLLECDLTRNS